MLGTQLGAEEAKVDDLEALLKEALTQSSKRRVKNATPAPRPKLSEAINNPENWKQTRTVSLVHQGPDGQTLLGNFHEFVYLHLVGTRKLCRVLEPSDTEGVEMVEGDWWITGKTRQLPELQEWIEHREAICGITLAECRVHSPDAAVRVRLEFGGIARVELTRDTRFTSLTRDTFLMLPQGCDILGAMDLDSKLALRAEIGL